MQKRTALTNESLKKLSSVLIGFALLQLGVEAVDEPLHAPIGSHLTSLLWPKLVLDFSGVVRIYIPWAPVQKQALQRKYFLIRLQGEPHTPPFCDAREARNEDNLCGLDQDALGLDPGLNPKFRGTYANAFEVIRDARDPYDPDLKRGGFPPENERDRENSDRICTVA